MNTNTENVKVLKNTDIADVVLLINDSPVLYASNNEWEYLINHPKVIEEHHRRNNDSINLRQ